MEGKFTPVYDESRERKPSYKKAVGVIATDDQAKAANSENASSNYNDPVDVFINSDGSSGSAIVKHNPVETLYIQENYQEKVESPRREKWSDFAEYSSLHGFRNVYVRASLWVRVLWLVLLLACTGWVLYSIYSSIKKYFQFPIATTIRIKYPKDGMPFPAVSLCPMTTFTKTRISMTDDNPWFETLGLDLPACNATAHVRAGRPCGEALLCCCSGHNVDDISVALNNCTEDYKKELLDVIKKDKNSFNDREFHKAYGPNFRRMMIRNTCEFMTLDDKCSYKDFVPTMTELGLCYTFNSGRDGKKVLNVSYGDTSTGLSLILDLNLNDHMAGAFNEGIRIIVHDQGVYINPANSVLVAPGTHAQISVKRKVYRNKEWPYETLCSDTKQLEGFAKYTSDGCYFECISKETANKCGCRLPSDSGDFDDRICFRDDDPCPYEVFFDMVKGTLECECPLACEVVNYDTTMSTAAFPNPSIIKILQTKGYNKTDDYLRKNLVSVLVAYTSNSYEDFKQKSQYDSGALMGEIGGNLGLFLGCSILTIIEFIDFAIFLCYTRNKKKS